MDMTKKLILAAWALLLAAAVPAQQKEEFRLWPEAGKYAPERLGAGFDRDNAPYVTLYRPEGKKPAPAVPPSTSPSPSSTPCAPLWRRAV